MGDEPIDGPATEEADESTEVERPAEVGETGGREPETAESPPSTGPAPPESATESTDSDEDGFRPRHPKALRLQLAIGGIALAITAAATLLAATLATLLAPIPPGAAGPIFAGAVALPMALVFPTLVLPRMRHRRYRYRADERGLEIRKGVWWRSHRIIPRSRLQHTDVTQGPLERQLGLASLVVHTAGTHEAETTLSGLSLETAHEVRGRLTGETDSEADGV